MSFQKYYMQGKIFLRHERRANVFQWELHGMSQIKQNALPLFGILFIRLYKIS